MILNNDLTLQEITELDLRIAGKLIKDLAFLLSRKVNQELMKPMSEWIDDPDWMSRFKISNEKTPNWAEYKRQQRQWTQQQKDLFRQRMQIYWQVFHKKRNMRKEVADLLNFKKGSSYYFINNTENQEFEITKTWNYLAPVLKTYSPPEEHKRNTHMEFMQALKISVSNLLPWRTILLSELYENQKDIMRFKDFKTRYMENPKKDKASKLIHLLQLDSEGTITLSQSEPFGDICISLETKTISTPLFSNHADAYDSKPRGSDTYSSITNNSEIIIKDSEGSTYNFDWQTLNNTQRNKVIADIKNNNILLYKVM
jgi:chromatin segregation and condensation protein Rec8/ScpA/Scc1 (kleisin family)